MDSLKMVAIGDGGIGKTSLLVSYARGEFPEEYVPTVFDNFTVNMSVNHRSRGKEAPKFYLAEDFTIAVGENEDLEKKVVSVALWDTAGQEEYHRLRPLAYPDTDVFLVCFSLTSITSLENIKSLWIPELKQHCPSTPFILVGLKQDLRRLEFVTRPEEVLLDFGESHISADTGIRLAQEIGACGYVECSARSLYNVNTVFEMAAGMVLEARQAPHPKRRHNKGGVSYQKSFKRIQHKERKKRTSERRRRMRGQIGGCHPSECSIL